MKERLRRKRKMCDYIKSDVSVFYSHASKDNFRNNFAKCFAKSLVCFHGCDDPLVIQMRSRLSLNVFKKQLINNGTATVVVGSLEAVQEGGI